jgi:ribosomal protein L37AE/L43A
MFGQEAHAQFTEIRWVDNQGETYCPACGRLKVYALSTRKIWKCAGCQHQFSAAAWTIFADRNLSIRHRSLPAPGIALGPGTQDRTNSACLDGTEAWPNRARRR